MSESLRDRVARVLCGCSPEDPDGVPCTFCLDQADALIAAGLVAEPAPEFIEFCVTGYADRVMFHAKTIEDAWGGIKRERERMADASFTPKRKVLARRKAGDWVEVPRDVWEGPPRGPL